jgi:hypothetical protein
MLLYRALLAPILFDRVALRNETDSATSALGPAKSKHGQYVKQLRFEGLSMEMNTSPSWI